MEDQCDVGRRPAYDERLGRRLFGVTVLAETDDEEVV
jgi:hypothetical protein